MQFSTPLEAMQRAIQLARKAEGYVEPNPLVGAVIVDSDGNLVSEGYHTQYGGPHAEVNAIRAASQIPTGATMYVTLEPCAHYGKTPPCCEAIIQAGIERVVIGCPDPARHEKTTGVERLKQANIITEIGLLEEQARLLIRPFTKLQQLTQPYIHAKWAMTLDGRIASQTGSSQWITNEASREYVHQLRGRMDGIMVGRGTVIHDDPLLTARPPGPRTPARIIVDSQATLSRESQLVQSIEQAPVIVAAANTAEQYHIQRLQAAGVEVLLFPVDQQGRPDVTSVLAELGSRQMTNLLVEGGSQLLGSLFDAHAIDEVHTFIAPKLIGGDRALSPLGGQGLAQMPDAIQLQHLQIQRFNNDLLLHGLIEHQTEEDVHG